MLTCGSLQQGIHAYYLSIITNILQEKFSAPDGDQLGQLQSQVNEVKDVMTQNIEKVMERGERLEDLIAQTDDLEAHVS